MSACAKSSQAMSACAKSSQAMSSPVSTPVSGGGFLVLEEGLEGAVLGGVVGLVGLPAVPDDVQPGAGHDSGGVGVVVLAGSGAVVEVGRPRVGMAGVSGEVGDRVAQVFVTGPAEPDGAHGARLSGRGCNAGQASQRFGGWEAPTTVPHFSEKLCRSYLSGAGQASEDVPVGVGGELFSDRVGQGLDLLDDGLEGSHQRPGDVGVCRGFLAGGTSRRGDQAGAQ